MVLDRYLVDFRLDIEVFCDGGSELASLFGRVVPDGNLWLTVRLTLHMSLGGVELTNVCTSFGESSCDLVSDTS